MILFTVGLMLITVVVAGASLPLLIIVGAMGGLGIYMLNRIPTIQALPQSNALAPATA